MISNGPRRRFYCEFWSFEFTKRIHAETNSTQTLSENEGNYLCSGLKWKLRRDLLLRIFEARKKQPYKFKLIVYETQTER